MPTICQGEVKCARVRASWSLFVVCRFAFRRYWVGYARRYNPLGCGLANAACGLDLTTRVISPQSINLQYARVQILQIPEYQLPES
jgi:hypothetical protein